MERERAKKKRDQVRGIGFQHAIRGNIREARSDRTLLSSSTCDSQYPA